MSDSAQELIESGRQARNRGDLAQALSDYEAAVVELRTMDAPLRLAHTIRHVGDILGDLGKWEQARSHYAEALALYRANALTRKLDLANTLRGYALALAALDEHPAATAMWTEARDLYAGEGLQAGVEEATRRMAKLP